jgi:membrane-associated phospholipid phosphatase
MRAAFLSGMKRRPLFLLLLFSLLLPVGSAVAQDGPARFLDWTVNDARDWGTSWNWERGLKVGTTVAVLAPMSLLDERISEKQRPKESPTGEFVEFANYLGGPKAKYVAVGVFGASLLTPSSKLQDATFTSLQSMVYSYMLGSLSKRVLIGRSRPYEEEGAFQFELLSNKNSSFPSGHATTAWALVMPYIVYYPGPVSFGLGLLATGTAIARLQRQQHWLTDILAGSMLGGSMGYWLAKKHQGELERFSLDVGPGGFRLTVDL